MPHVFVVGRIHESGMDLLEQAADVTFEVIEGASEDSYAPRIGEADAVVIRTQPMTATTVDRADRLKIVSRHGVGFDTVDHKALARRGIPLAVVGNVNSVAVAEHAMMLMLGAAKLSVRADGAVRSGEWAWRERPQAREISGKNLLLIGYGRIGQRVAALASSFAMTVRAFDPYIADGAWPEGEAKPAHDLHAALGWADFVSVHVPKSDRPIIGAEEFGAMKSGAVLINTARGGIVDEAALVTALHAGKLHAAGFDVFGDEPPRPDHPLFSMDNVVLSPHIAGLTAEGAERLAIHSVQNVLDFFAGRLDPGLVVNGVRPHA